MPRMPTHSLTRPLRRVGRLAAAVAGAATLVVVGVSAGGASAATPTTTPATTPAKPAGPSVVFCAQLRTSQTAMAQLNAQSKDRYAKVAAEWAKIERFAPADIKSDVTAIRTAYEKAAAQTGAAQTATLKTAATPAQKVTTYATKSCAAMQGAGQGQGRGQGGPGGFGDGDGPNAEAFQAFQDCMAKQGVTSFGFGGGRNRQGGQGGQGQAPQSPPTTTAKTAAALAKCQSLLPNGGRFGGGFGRGGGFGSPELQACLQKKGVTLPQPGQGAAGQGGPGQGRGFQIDDKTRAAIQECRQQLGETGPNGNRAGGPTTTVKKTTV